MPGVPLPDETRRPIRIACVGGGIGGLALALGLANQQRRGANIEFQIFEAAPQFKEIGAGVGVGPNAYRAISLLGLQEPYSKLAFTHDPEESGTYFTWRWGEKEKIQEHGGDDLIGETPCFQKGGHTTIHRAAFLDMMIDHLPPGCANFNKRLIKYAVADRSSHRQSAAPIQLFFEDGSTYEADLLLAADGIKSAIRPQMLADMMPPEQLKPQFTNTIAYRALVPMEEMVAKVGEKVRRGTMFLGKNKHILIFPIQTGKVLNIVAFSSDRSSAKPPSWENEAWIVPGSKEEMLSGWEGWSEDCLEILKAISKPDKWALHELCDLPTHVKGPVCLFGDSAAATLPHQGQGAAQAIESAYVLSTLLGSPALNRSNAATALEVFNELRHDRATKVKTTSNELGRILEFADGQINGNKEGLQKNLKERYQWMWAWDGKDAERGLETLSERLRA